MFERRNDSVYIASFLQETKRLAECHFSDHIKGIYSDLAWKMSSIGMAQHTIL